ncbi:MAG: hypothetical protein IPQ07_17910 [Myxococcales bacterium]|nr:hypothetical protein [Myxococcales bacterium]
MLAEAQALGYAEADPTLDVGGGDAAHKLAILVNLCFGTTIDVAAIPKDGIVVDPIDLADAEKFGYVIKPLVIARARRPGTGPIEARVRGARRATGCSLMSPARRTPCTCKLCTRPVDVLRRRRGHVCPRRCRWSPT